MASVPTSPTALIIGAGIVGHACALSLQARGFYVALSDPDRAAVAPSWGNAGHIATEQAEPLASPAVLRSALRRHVLFGGALDIRNLLTVGPWIRRYLHACTPRRFAAGNLALRGLLAEALPAWRRLANALEQPQLLRETGHWVCWESAASTARGTRTWATTDTGSTCHHLLQGGQRQALAAALQVPIPGGIAFDGTAQIADPLQLRAALEDRFMRNGGTRRHDRIDTLPVEDGRAQARTREGRPITADLVVICAGVRSRALMASIGTRAPLVAERGYHLHWARHEWPDLPPVVFEDRSMIVTRFAGGLRAASFVEYADVDAPPDPRKWQRLHQHVRELGVPVHGEAAQWFGARPTLPDYLPAIGRSVHAENLYYAFGHQHLGLTLAPITGELLTALIVGDAPTQDLAPFDIQRFA